MQFVVKKDSTDYHISIPMFLSSDHLSPATGKTVTATISKNGGSFSAVSGTIAEIGSSGVYKWTANATDRNTLGLHIVEFSAADSDTIKVLLMVVTHDPFTNQAILADAAHGGSSASFAFGAGGTISNASGTALTLTSSGSNGRGLRLIGHGTGSGLRIEGGATAAGMSLVGGSTSGAGLAINTTDGAGITVSAAGGSGIYVSSSTTHAAQFIAATSGTFHGIYAVAGDAGGALRLVGGTNTGGAGLHATGTTGAIYASSATNGNGHTVTGAGTGHGQHITAGASGKGLLVNAASDRAVVFASTGNGGGFAIDASAGTGTAVLMASQAGVLMSLQRLSGTGGAIVVSTGVGTTIFDAAIITELQSGLATSAEASSILSAVQNIQNNTFIGANIPHVIERPDSGTEGIDIVVLFNDAEGSPADIDSSADPTLLLFDSSGNNLSARVSAWSHPVTGKYTLTYTSSSTDDIEQIHWEITGTVNTKARRAVFSSQIVDTTAVDFTSADRTKLEAIHTKLPSKAYLAGSSNSDGDIQLDEATGAFVSGAFTNIPKTGYALSNTGLDLIASGGVTLPVAVFRSGATLWGTVTDARSGTEIFTGAGITITYTVDGNGNRTAVAFS